MLAKIVASYRFFRRDVNLYYYSVYTVCSFALIQKAMRRPQVPLKGYTDPTDPSTRIANTTCEKKVYEKRKHEGVYTEGRATTTSGEEAGNRQAGMRKARKLGDVHGSN